jgi:channel protein (hemolysin III family)
MDEWYSIGGFNDPMSSLSHLVGLVIFFVFSIFLIRSSCRSRTVFWFSFQFVIAALLLLSMSFVFHMMAVGGTARAVMLRLDIAAIFVLIASTISAFHGILFQGWKRWGVVAAIWTIAIVGITLRTIFFRSIPPIVGDGIFLLMGWIGASSSWLLWKDYGWAAVRPVIIGGMFYTGGAIINAINQLVLIDKVWGPHETFHFCVLFGLGVHWSFVWRIADGSFQRELGMSSTTSRSRPSSV